MGILINRRSWAKSYVIFSRIVLAYRPSPPLSVYTRQQPHKTPYQQACIPMFPIEFTRSLQEILPASEAEELCAALEAPSPVSVRYNPYKITDEAPGRAVPWCRYGRYLKERPSFTLDPAFHCGAYYVQEASSMFIGHLYEQAMARIGRNRDAGLRILDLCAAPGGKTTLLATLAGLENIVVANEVIRARAMTLADNVRKWGLGNVVVTNNDPAHFVGLQEYFDVIAVDAPCSGEGMFRKDLQAREQWSPENVRLCAQRQRRILSDIWGSLKPGGILLYSTCTFNRTEDEENIAWLVDQYDCEPIEVELDPAWGIVRSEEAGICTFRFYPHRVEGEGFFAAVLHKADGKVRLRTPKPRRTILVPLPRPAATVVGRWFGQPEHMCFAQAGDNIYGYYGESYPMVKVLSESLSVVYSGVLAGQLFGGKLRPEHPLALFHDLAQDSAPSVRLGLEEARQYLRKQEIDVSLLQEGINLVRYGELPLGWIKRIGHRANNMYPKELRIATL